MDTFWGLGAPTPISSNAGLSVDNVNMGTVVNRACSPSIYFILSQFQI